MLQGGIIYVYIYEKPDYNKERGCEQWSFMQMNVERFHFIYRLFLCFEPIRRSSYGRVIVLLPIKQLKNNGRHGLSLEDIYKLRDELIQVFSLECARML